ncbi:hypothetical protein WJX81_001079 [Elliptochloris bilobata]|uniref:Phospholipid-transporting ATPase n=1 Tax=Elliptochloris bilobata TaxID=381761 RepID=A0AAW1SJ90_9CHLO
MRRPSRADRTPYRRICINQPAQPQKYTNNYVATTKYNLVTFLPKALYEQFRRVANMYFTLVAGISCTSISPIRPITTFLPLAIVLGVSIFKEAMEDVRRYQADCEVNRRACLVFSPAAGAWQKRRWRDVRVGEVVQVASDSFFPADLLLLASANAEGIAYVETINLDGESNLKIKKALDATRHLSPDTVAGLQGEIHCEHPDASLYTFVGNLLLGPPGVHALATLPLSPASVLLRGSVLRNTRSALGVVIFAGHESKVMKNATLPPSKRSSVERQMDIVILFMFALLFAMCVANAACFAVWTQNLTPAMWYLATDSAPPAYDPDNAVLVGVYSFIASFVLYGYLIPISLYVSLEMVKVGQAFLFINSDRNMYHTETDTPASARTSNLNEELGMVHTILSDKTGTLTCNVMEFFKCSVGGVSYGTGVTEIERAAARRAGAPLPADPGAEPLSGGGGGGSGALGGCAPGSHTKGFNFADARLTGGAWQREARPALLREFFRVLAVCHTVIPDGPEEPDKIRYQAESPDEAALVAAGRAFGFFFFRRTNTTVLVREGGADAEYEILNILEFDSMRKRMSVIARTPEGKIMLYCKGADTVIYERLDTGNPLNAELRPVTRAHMEGFGAAGLRTLCLASAELDPDFYDEWQDKYHAAKTALARRDEAVAAVAEAVEVRLQLLGCTAIEDKLQAGVPETIANLAAAAIRLWVLTGDKQETAVNIGFACSLLRTDMALYRVSAEVPAVTELEDTGRFAEAAAVAAEAVRQQLADALLGIEAAREAAGAYDNGGDSALVIDGKALAHALGPDMRQSLLAVGKACAAVVCCRVSPKQKALVTALVKSTGVVTLGIGDGANDVGMIQEAHIGVGISGQEGMQAVMSSDFAIAQFRFLEQLLLVHGRWSYLRITRMVAFFFYKNLLFGLTIFFYNIFCLFSGQILYDDFYMSLYNVVFTMLPPLVVGTIDQDVNCATSRCFPGLYQAGVKNMYFGARALAGWLVSAAFQAGCMVAMVLAATAPTIASRSDGSTWSHWEVGTLLFTEVVLTVHLELATVLEHWTWLHYFAICFSVGIWFAYLLVYGALPLWISGNIYSLLIGAIAPKPAYWLILALVPVACVLPGFLLRSIGRRLWPGDRRLVMEMQVLGRHATKPAAAGASPAVAAPAQRALRHTVSVNTGYVPSEAPGALGYYTPRRSMAQSAEALGLARNSLRHPVIAALHEAAVADPGRVCRSSSSSRTLSARNSAFGKLSPESSVPASALDRALQEIKPLLY